VIGFSTMTVLPVTLLYEGKIFHDQDDLKTVTGKLAEF
jgi:hypothetical protein